jgi:hypothetical protein
MEELQGGGNFLERRILDDNRNYSFSKISALFRLDYKFLREFNNLLQNS